ncbi:hypothetical protein RhiirC2_831283 [Rhizophagus irregularis]|uniref:Uncharacterized protein n=1 Tax=Rhizophagus irregularis TaxID=588596 RepID=A0A2N1N755_9GLOM|nr:hypothetical protein RhiirC2_831283 [Rhizophagus irregularis]
MKETVDFSKIFKDVDNLLGSVTIEKPVDFCKLLCKSMTEGDIQNIWTDTERHESKKRMDIYLETKISYYNQIGCSVRCPLCSSKCELPDDGHTHHLVVRTGDPLIRTGHIRLKNFLSGLKSVSARNITGYAIAVRNG